MTNKAILKRKEHRRRKREWKLKVLQFAKEFYNTSIQKESTPSEEVRRFFEGGQNVWAYLRGGGIRQNLLGFRSLLLLSLRTDLSGLQRSVGLLLCFNYIALKFLIGLVNFALVA